jgi:Holliday junction resolvase
LGKNGSVYERELKGILGGETDKLERIKWIDNDLKERINKRPFLVVRAAGSHGFDIIIIRDDISIPIEIKSSKERVINFSSSSKRSQIQAEYYVELLQRTKVMPIYAFRTKSVGGDPWRIFTFDLEYTKNYRILSEIIPKLEKTKSGSYTMKWDKGLSFTSFLEYLF